MDFPHLLNGADRIASEANALAGDVWSLALHPLTIELHDPDECFHFVRLAASGHPGSITSVHAGSCALAIEQMSLMIRESGAGGGLCLNEIKGLLNVVIDVIVQFDRDERGRFVSEILYEPRTQRCAQPAIPVAAT